jgi:hypothetical protein
MSSPITPVVQSKIEHWRKSCQDGTITIEDYKEAIRMLRGGREAAAKASSTTARKKAIAAVPSAEDLLDELDDL